MNETACDFATQRLPWLLNGSLDEAERRQVEEHLRSCAECRRELAETRAAWRIYGAHLPVAALVGYAAAGAGAGASAGAGPAEIDLGEAGSIRRGRVDEHLAHCARCREELEMVEASRRALDEEAEAEAQGSPAAAAPTAAAGRVVPLRRPVRPAAESRPWLPLALAASLLLAVVAAGGWLLTWRQASETRARLAAASAGRAQVEEPAGAGPVAPEGAGGAGEVEPARIGELEGALAAARSEVEATNDRIGELESQISRLSQGLDRLRSASPQVINLVGATVSRGAVESFRVQGDAPLAVLSIYPSLADFQLSGRTVRYRLTDAAGRELAAGTLPRRYRDEVGEYLSLFLDPSELPAGDLTLTILDGDREAARFPLHVVR